MVFLVFGGFATLPIYVRTMMALGIIATAIYAFLYVAPWRRFRRAVSIADWTAAERSFGQVRLLVAVTLARGLVAAVIGAGAPYDG